MSEHFCPDGLVFDEPASTCNYPWASPPCDTTEEDEDIEETTTVQAETEPDPEQGDQVEVEEEALEEVTTVPAEVEAGGGPCVSAPSLLTLAR